MKKFLLSLLVCCGLAAGSAVAASANPTDHPEDHDGNGVLYPFLVTASLNGTTYACNAQIEMLDGNEGESFLYEGGHSIPTFSTPGWPDGRCRVSGTTNYTEGTGVGNAHLQYRFGVRDHLEDPSGCDANSFDWGATIYDLVDTTPGVGSFTGPGAGSSPWVDDHDNVGQTRIKLYTSGGPVYGPWEPQTLCGSFVDTANNGF